MKKEDRVLLARAYQSAWYAFKGQAIAVSAQDSGWFTVRHNVGGYPHKMRASDLLESLVRINESLAVKRETQEA
jgi:hypothetical protein